MLAVRPRTDDFVTEHDIDNRKHLRGPTQYDLGIAARFRRGLREVRKADVIAVAKCGDAEAI